MPKPSKNKPYTADDMREISDSPEWVRSDLAKAKRFEEILPGLARTIRRRGRQTAPTKQAVSIRLDADVLKAYKATGAGWQSRINDDLRRMKKLG